MHRQRLLFALTVGLVPIAACASAPPEPAPEPIVAPVAAPSAAVAPPAGLEQESMPSMPEFRAKLPTDSGAFYIPTADPLHPRVHYAEGQDSLNDSCIVLTGNKLSRRVPPAFVNGRPIGFC